MDAGRTIIIMIAVAVILIEGILLIRERKKRKDFCRQVEMLLACFADDAERKNAYRAMGQDIVVSSDDLSRIIRQLQKLQEYVEMLKERSELEKEEVKTIVTDISHQLKNPVAVMDMSLSLLEDESLTAQERKEFTERLRLAMKELETLMSSLIQISRMETGLIELKLEKTPLIDTITKALNFTIVGACEKNISIELEDEDKIADQQILHDSKWMAEALINILDNAIKYSPENSRILIRPILRNGFLRLEIEDQGIGIPKNERNKVMTRFYRGKNPQVAACKGSGVGLFLVNKIVRMHGGMVIIHDGRNEDRAFPGTNIIIQIPDEA